MTQPENFFDMRQAKRSDRSPDFKHKFVHQAVWLNSAPSHLVQLVQQWDSSSSDSMNKVNAKHSNAVHCCKTTEHACVQECQQACYVKCHHHVSYMTERDLLLHAAFGHAA